MMNLLPATTSTTAKTFNLLSIGQRGVGKTVFLAGSYLELQSHIQIDNPSVQEYWFDCQDMQAKQNMEQLLSYVARTGQYPPATMKIANFNFSLKHQNMWSEKTLCHFRWWDIPGEICNIRDNRDFQRMVLSSHGCCVFINADALIHDRDYLRSLENVVRQVMGIASLVSQKDLHYPLALIFTKCDLLQLGPLSQLLIEQNLQPLITILEAAKANYKRFYSAISIVSTQDGSTLKAKGAAAPLLWLTLELRKINNSQVQQDLGSGLIQNSPELMGKEFAVEKAPALNVALTVYKYILPLLLTTISLMAIAVAMFLAFNQSTFSLEQAFKRQLNILSPAVDRSEDYTDAR